jgi:hypothetical protein
MRELTTRTIQLAISMLLLSKISFATAGDLNVNGGMNVTGNLTATSITLGGQVRSNWTGGAIDLTSPVIDFSQPGFYRYTLTDNATWVFSNHVAGSLIWLRIAEDATGGRTNAWPVDTLWPGDAPVRGGTEAGHWNVYKILDDGTNWLAEAAGVNYSLPCSTNCSYALMFDGSQNYFVTDSSPAFTGSVFTAEAWIRLQNKGGGQHRLLGTYTGDSGWLLWVQSGSAHVVCGGASSMTGGSGLEDNQWHYLALVLDGTTAKLFVDCILVAESPDMGTSGDFSWDHFSVGGSPDDQALNPALGVIDEVRLSSSAHDAHEITNNPCIYQPLTVLEDTVALWHLDDGNGTTAADAGGNYNGTLQGSPPPVWVTGLTSGYVPFGSQSPSELGYGDSIQFLNTSSASMSLSNNLRATTSTTTSNAARQAQRRLLRGK